MQYSSRITKGLSIVNLHYEKKRNAHTLVELIIVVVILGAMAFIAVPRLRFAVRNQKQADTVARKIVTDLRRARQLAITDAATNTSGFSLNRSGSTFEIEDLSDSSTVANSTFTVGSKITCSGGTSFQFGPLGNLKAGSDNQLVISAGGNTFTIDITSATGTIKCTKS